MDSAKGFRLLELQEEAHRIEVQLKDFSGFEKGSETDIEYRTLATRLGTIDDEQMALMAGAVTCYSDHD
jgi:hypothetical protein